MPVKLRLALRGRKNSKVYHLVAADSRAPRDGRFLEKLGTYDLQHRPSSLHINEEAILAWLDKGAQPTPTVDHLLSRLGLKLQRHLQLGVAKKAITQEVADHRLKMWYRTHGAKHQHKLRVLAGMKRRQAALAAPEKKAATAAAQEAAASSAAPANA